MDKASIASVLQATSDLGNKEAHRAAGAVWSEVLRARKVLEKEVRAETRKELIENPPQALIDDILGTQDEDPMTEDELMDALRRLMEKRVREDTATAAEIAQIKDIFNLRQKERDITIEVVDHSGLPEAGIISLAERLHLALANGLEESKLEALLVSA